MENSNEISILSISKITRAKNGLIKSIYIIFLTVLSSVCAYYIFLQIMNYLEYEIVNYININDQKHVPLPVITLCVPSQESFMRLNQSLDCTFKIKPCNWYDFEYYDTNFTEKCIRFNSGKNYYNQLVSIKNVTDVDPNTGLILLFSLKEYFYDILYNISLPFKVKLFINNQSQVFRRDKIYELDSGFVLTAGITFIKLDRSFIYRLGKPYNGCLQDNTTEYVSHLYQYFKRNRKTYLQRDCYDLCMEEIIKRKCNCNIELGQNALCYNNSVITQCFFKTLIDYKIESITFPKECHNYCPRECVSMNYEIDQNYLGIFPKDFFKLNGFKYYNYSTIQEDSFFIVIYFKDLDYTEIREIPKTYPYDLFSNIGGLLSLFVGISLISIIEITDLAFNLILYAFRKKTSMVNTSLIK